MLRMCILSVSRLPACYEEGFTLHTNTPLGVSFDVGVVGHTSPLLLGPLLLGPFRLHNRRMMFTAFIACIIACGKKGINNGIQHLSRSKVLPVEVFCDWDQKGIADQNAPQATKMNGSSSFLR